MQHHYYHTDSLSRVSNRSQLMTIAIKLYSFPPQKHQKYTLTFQPIIGATIIARKSLFYNDCTSCTALLAIYLKSYWPMMLLLMTSQFYCRSPLKKIIVADLDFLMIYMHSRASYAALYCSRRRQTSSLLPTRSLT